MTTQGTAQGESATATPHRTDSCSAKQAASEQLYSPLAEGVAARACDIFSAGLALVLLSPLLALSAFAARLKSERQVLLRQIRNGLNGRPFKIYKFGTMTVLEDGTVVRQATRGDKRVTRTGDWLQGTSVDELPQLVKVLRGDMSLVGLGLDW